MNTERPGLSQRRAVLRYLGERAAARLGIYRPSQTGRPKVRTADLVIDEGALAHLLDIARADPAAGEEGRLPGWVPGIWEAPLVPELLRVAGYPFPFRGVLNLGVQRSVLRAPETGAGHSLDLMLAGSEPIRSGEKIAIDSILRDARGDARIRSRLWVLLRRPASKRKGGSHEALTDYPRAIAAWELGPSDARQYAEVSGDRNPIHLGGIVGRLLGYPRPILHGACLEAMAWSALAPGIGEGDFSIRFERPLVLPASVAVCARERSGSDPVAFAVVPSGGGRPFATGYHVDSISRQAQG